MLSYWVYLLAVVVLAATFFVPGGPTGAGWTLYPPQAILSGTPAGLGHHSHAGLLILFIIGFTMGGLNYVVTVLQARTRGMTLMRLPLTVWGIFTATAMALLAFPALFVASVMLLLDRLLGTSFFMPTLVEMGTLTKYGGGSPICSSTFSGSSAIRSLHRRLPAFGIISDLISVHARKNIFGYRMMVWAIVGIGALSFVVWAHHMYVSGMHPYFGFFFATTRSSSPSDRHQGLQLGADPVARRHSSHHPDAVRAGVHHHIRKRRPDRPFSRQRGRRRSVVRHDVRGRPLSYGDGIAPIMAVFGGIYHWYPKVTGRMLNEALGRFHFWVSFLGAYAVFSPCTISVCWACPAAITTSANGLHPGIRP